jgi:hypothetical protein
MIEGHALALLEALGNVIAWVVVIGLLCAAIVYTVVFVRDLFSRD